MSVTSGTGLVEGLRSEPLESFVSSLIEAAPGSNLSKIVGLFKELAAYEIFFPKGLRCGMISARNVLKTTNIESTKMSTLMSYVPVLKKDATVREAARLMADYRIRGIPVSDGRNIIGQVNSANLLAGLRGKMGGEMRITSIATRDPIRVEAESFIAKARKLLVRKRIDHLPVTLDGRLSGILMSTHIVSRFAPLERVGSKAIKPETRRGLDVPVRDVMEINPLNCSADTSAEEALNLILRKRTSYILVTQWDELQAIATHRDFMKLLAEPEPEIEAPIFMVGLPEDPFEAEATKSKFKRSVTQLCRVFPNILEARSVIKAKFSKAGKERGRYEVSVNIRTSKNSFAYTDEGWELPALYDSITDRLKRLMTQKQKPRRARERERPEIP